MKHITIAIQGLVQGVFFRVFLKQAATSLGITGHVKNQMDGSILVEAEGNESALKEFLQRCQQGPPHAEVKKIETEERENLFGYHSFEIQ